MNEHHLSPQQEICERTATISTRGIRRQQQKSVHKEFVIHKNNFTKKSWKIPSIYRNLHKDISINKVSIHDFNLIT